MSALKPTARAVIIVAAVATTVRAQPPIDPDFQSPGILNDYIYGYAPVALEAVRAIETAVPDATIPGLAPINQFARVNRLLTAADRFIPRPNADTLYTIAWLDLSHQPMILHVPDTAGRYYLMPMLDAYSNEFASIGLRTTGTGAGNYAIVGPFWRQPVPNVTGVVRAPTNTVWMIGRTLVRGEADLTDAIAVTDQYALVPLDAWPAFLQTGNYTPPVGVPVTQPNPEFIAAPIASSKGFSEPAFFDVLARYALQNPALSQLAQSSALVLDGFLHQQELTPDIVQQANQELLATIVNAGVKVNGWSINLTTGNYGTNYLLRAATARFGLGANMAADAVYPGAIEDVNGNPLDGTQSYVIHFEPGQEPPAHGFWSLTAYDAVTGFLIDNPINRYSVGSETSLVPNADGSIDIFLQSSEPNTQQSNWLPTSASSSSSSSSSSTAFTLTLRIYWPDQSVLTGQWTPPVITPTGAPLP